MTRNCTDGVFGLGPLGARRVVGTRRAPISPQRPFSLEQVRRRNEAICTPFYRSDSHILGSESAFPLFKFEAIRTL